MAESTVFSVLKAIQKMSQKSVLRGDSSAGRVMNCCRNLKILISSLFEKEQVDL